jgi:hypothetical protein
MVISVNSSVISLIVAAEVDGILTEFSSMPYFVVADLLGNSEATRTILPLSK